MALLLCCPTTDAKNKKDKKKYQKKEVVAAQVTPAASEQPLTITAPDKQIYGEWTVVKLDKRQLPEGVHAYFYLDFAGGNKVYGNTGCNDLNATFALTDDNITFKDFVLTSRTCHSSTEKSFLKALNDCRKYTVTAVDGVGYLHLLSSKGTELMVLKRQNFDFLAGAWRVNQIGEENVDLKDIKLIIDPVMHTLHGNTGCNIINGYIHIDPLANQDFSVQFEDIRSSQYHCPNINDETNLLIALELTTACRRINAGRVALLDRQGNTLVILDRINLR